LIKIQDKIWAVVEKSRAPLAYMCQVTEKADGTPDSATAKMQDTGRSWSRSGPIGNQQRGDEATYENIPVLGFTLGDSVSRWTTQNKLFEVVDPRGFMVQVATGNIALLLKHCTIVNGVVQEECVWGREGGSHILLPVNSEPYLEAKKIVEQVATGLVKPADLKLGDRCKMMAFGHGLDATWEFLGTVKLSWVRKCSKNQYEAEGFSRYHSRTRLKKSEPLDDETLQDDKWVHIFKWVTQDGRDIFEIELTPKIMERVAGEPSIQLGMEHLLKGYQYCPERVMKKFKHELENRNTYAEWRVVGKDTIADFKLKPEKK